VAHFLPGIFQFLSGVVSPGVRKYYLIIKALQIPLSLSGWALSSLLTFSPIMLNNPDTREEVKKRPELKSLQPGFQTVMGQLLGAALVCSLVLLIERFLIQLISINYHRKQFDEKIKGNKRSIFLLATLYDASRTLFPAYCNEFAEEDYIINDALNLSALGKNNKRGSVNPMRLLQNVGHNVGRVGDKVGAAFGAVAQEITGRRIFDLESGHSIVVEALDKTRSCEALARRLWFSFVVEGNENLYQSDIVEVLGLDKRAEAEEAFNAIDRDGNGDISLEEMVMTITEIGRARKSIASSMHDVDQAINVLDGLLMAIVFVVCIFIVVGFVNRSFVTTLAAAGTALLSISFVFATTTQEFLGSCIFLFVKHPFDIGDRVDITKEPLVVERISLLFCVFKRVTDGRTVQIPNIVLNSLWVDNITRSKAMREQISLFCHFETSFDDIKTLKEEMLKFVTDKENNRDFHPDVEIEVLGIAEMNKMELKVEVKHKSNWSNETVRAARRSKFMCALVLALRRVPIYGPGAGDAPLGSVGAPTYSVALTADIAQKNKNEFAAKKEAKRLIPVASATASAPKSQTMPSGPSGTMEIPGVTSMPVGTTEYLAVQNLNQRSAASDPMRDDTWAARDDNSSLGERASFDRSDGQSERGLLNRETSHGRRQPNQGIYTTTYTSEEPLPPRGPSNISYAPPPPPSTSQLGPSQQSNNTQTQQWGGSTPH
jgi:small-conductance mechanosensitive channel